MSPARADRYAISVVVVAVVALVLVLGLWQRVDAACEGDGFDRSDPLATCTPPEDVDLGRVSADPAG